MGFVMKYAMNALAIAVSVCAFCWLLKSCGSLGSSVDETRLKENAKISIEEEKTKQLQIKFKIDSLNCSSLRGK